MTQDITSARVATAAPGWVAVGEATLMCDEERQIPTASEYQAALSSLEPQLTLFHRQLLRALHRANSTPLAVPTIAEQLNATPEAVSNGLFEIFRMLHAVLGDGTDIGLYPMQTITATAFGAKYRKWLWTLNSGISDAISQSGWL